MAQRGASEALGPDDSLGSAASSRSNPKRRLGKGLSSLMTQPVSVHALDEGAAASHESKSTADGVEISSRTMDGATDNDLDGATPALRALPIDRIRPNRYQPRKAMDPERLGALAASIRSAGVMQPVLVRRDLAASGGYELIAGERRWRAAQLAGLDRIPAIVSDLSDAQSAEWAVVENLQREDLDPIERAEAFRSLVDRFGLTHAQIAERVGMDRSSVANTLRLNHLDEATKIDVRAGRLSQGHAKALLALEDPRLRRRIAEAAMAGGWSVRQLERRVEELQSAGPPSGGLGASGPGGAPAGGKPDHILRLEEEIAEGLGLPTRIRYGKNRTSGEVILTFRNLGEFESFQARARHGRAT